MDERPVLNQVNLVVKDMSKSVAFYRRLGLEIPDTTAAFQAHHRSSERRGPVDFDIDSEAFARHWGHGHDVGPVVLGFHVEQRERVDAIYRDLTQAGYVGQDPPHDAFWGARYAVVLDPDGNRVGLMSAIDPARRVDPGFSPEGDQAVR
jgi:catechol 2,3-dioxygenase-like lactoylglutathione lyase family enzyme